MKIEILTWMSSPAKSD